MRIVGLVCMTLGASWPVAAWAESPALPLTSLRAAEAAWAAGAVQPEPETPEPTSSPAPGGVTTVEPPQPTSSKAPPSTLQPTSSKAPPSTVPVPDETDPTEEEPTEEPATEEGEGEELTLESQRSKAGRDSKFRRHAIGAHGGINVIPTWILSNWLATHTNALCRGSNIGGFAADRGLNQQDGCNFYVGGDYTYRFSRVLDVVASVQYQRAKVPAGLWLDKARYDGSAGSIEAADYTEIDLGLIAMEVDFIARAPVVITKDVEFGIGGGGGLGLGVLLGGIYQTPLGSAPAGFTPAGGRTDTCQTLEDLGDLTRCTPRYDVANDGDMVPPDENELSNPNAELFATCTSTECNENDIKAFGYRAKQGGLPPVIPVVNLILSMRLIIKDAVGITINGGFNTGFYFGGGLQYFFGKSAQDEMTTKPVEARRKRMRAQVGRV
jgi:hypothetical protein